MGRETPPRFRYMDIVSDIRSAIRAVTVVPGDQLPTEEELARAYSVSRQTVRRAYQVLEDDGLIDRRPGRGTVVAHGGLQRLIGARFRIGTQGQCEPESRHVEAALVVGDAAPTDLAATLWPVLRVRGQFVVGPHVVATSVVWTDEQNIVERWSELRGHPPAAMDPIVMAIARGMLWSTERLEADVATVDECHLMQLPVGHPILRVYRYAGDTRIRLIVELAVDTNRVQLVASAGTPSLRLRRDSHRRTPGSRVKTVHGATR